MSDPEQLVRHIVDHAAHYLPSQGPIGTFIHHNTLHAFQDLDFEHAVVEASDLFQTEPYISEDRFRHELRRDRIEAKDIDFILRQEENQEILKGELDRHQLLRTILLTEPCVFDEQTIFWELEEGQLAKIIHTSPDAGELFRSCSERLKPELNQQQQKFTRPRDMILQITGNDLDEMLHPVLIRLCAAYLDQGISYWPMPGREEGFLQCVRKVWESSTAIDPEKLGGFGRKLREQRTKQWDATQTIISYLQQMQIPQDQWEIVLIAELLALPGWAGMFRRLEEAPELASHRELKCSLLDYLAVRLTLLSSAIHGMFPKGINLGNMFAEIPDSLEAQRTVELASFFDIVRRLGLNANDVRSLSEEEFSRLYREIKRVGSVERRRLFHLAYERWHERNILDPIAAFQKINRRVNSEKIPAAQVIFCLDEREESIRRHLEEIDPEVETHGAAGFFGVAVNYTGIDDGGGAPLCPVVVKPQHAVHEVPVEDDHHLYQERQKRRKIYRRTSRGVSIFSQTMVRGWLSVLSFGIWSVVPLAGRVLVPRRFSQLRKFLDKVLIPEPRTSLALVREEEERRTAEGLMMGFSIPEKVERVADLLLPAGMTNRFSRLVLVIGHGSSSLNNPYESAYDCGACGGRGGGPNARLYAAMANRPEVRQGLREKGIFIPEDTWFVGGYHDTCNDDIDLYDLDLVPLTHQPELERIRKSLDQARMWNAHERTRRFEAAERDADPLEALHHVQERAEHLAEPRPELGHCTNSLTYIGRRATVRGLFLDRRAFLTSYDPLQDADDLFLSSLLAAALPVCGGINLEYYFSTVDNERYGSGTKLPHNVTSLIGVMNGHSSDLLTGLPSQMIEIHEPVRSLFIVETTPERFLNALSRIPHLSNLVENHWVRIVTLDPLSGQMHVYRKEGFEPYHPENVQIPLVKRSMDWYQGKMDHLPVAIIEEGMMTA